MSASYDAYHEGQRRRDPAKMTTHVQEHGCPKCGHRSGDDWSQCSKRCPVPGSPHFDEPTFKEAWSKAKLT